MPAGANKWVFVAAPGLAVITAFLAIAVVPYGGSVTLPSAAGFLAPVLAGVALGRESAPDRRPRRGAAVHVRGLVAGRVRIVMAGWAANNKFTLIGGLRSSAQMFSYELALGLVFVTLDHAGGLVPHRRHRGRARPGRWVCLHWNAFVQLPGLPRLLRGRAPRRSNRTPFDLPEAETELVAGFHTEYSSMRFALIQMAEYVNMITVAALGTNLFLGGWHSPRARSCPTRRSGSWSRCSAVLFFFIWLRGTLPRFRYDQLMHFGWKVLVPLAAVWILVTAAARGAARAVTPWTQRRSSMRSAALALVSARGGGRPAQPDLQRVRAHRHAVLAVRDLRPARLALHRRAAGDRLRGRDHGAVPVRADAAERQAREDARPRARAARSAWSRWPWSRCWRPGRARCSCAARAGRGRGLRRLHAAAWPRSCSRRTTCTCSRPPRS